MIRSILIRSFLVCTCVAIGSGRSLEEINSYRSALSSA